jgi:hypothetical protein
MFMKTYELWGSKDGKPRNETCGDEWHRRPRLMTGGGE